jgi:predicted RNA-binding protein
MPAFSELSKGESMNGETGIVKDRVVLGDVIVESEKFVGEVRGNGFGTSGWFGLGNFRQGNKFIFRDWLGHQFEFELTPIPVDIVSHRISAGEDANKSRGHRQTNASKRR